MTQTHDTKEKILDVATSLFGEQGYSATSLRQIIAEAGVNLAAVHYHFGSKEELLDQVILQKAGPLNERRLAMLEHFQAEAETGPVQIQKVLEAFLIPAVDAARRNPQFVKLMGRMHLEGRMPAIMRRHFQPAIQRFLEAFRCSMPDLPEDEFLWRIHFMIGAMAHAMCGTPMDLPLDPAEIPTLIRRLVVFLTGGLVAPAAQFQEL